MRLKMPQSDARLPAEGFKGTRKYGLLASILAGAVWAGGVRGGMP